MSRSNASALARFPGGVWRFAVLGGFMALTACAAGDAQRRVEASTAAIQSPTVQASFTVDGGTLALEFQGNSAPVAIAALQQLFAAHQWKGVAFDWVQPHVEIRTGLPPSASSAIGSELDALALGLDQQRIADVGAAMNLVQMELEPAFMRAGVKASPQLRAWIGQWRAHFDAAFLVGISRQQINEALGEQYRRGYASKPVRRGSIALVPAAPGASTLALAIILRDQPARDGRWVVVGRVVAGLDLAERISIAPRVHPKSHEPQAPVQILRSQLAPIPVHQGGSP